MCSARLSTTTTIAVVRLSGRHVFVGIPLVRPTLKRPASPLI